MLYSSLLTITNQHDIWFLSDDKGVVGCSPYRGVLSDCIAYARIHKVKSAEELKSRFSNSIVFVR